MKRRREGTLGQNIHEGGAPKESAGFRGLNDFLGKANNLANDVIREYSAGTLMAQRAGQLRAQIERIGPEVERGPDKHTVYRGIVAAIAFGDLLGEIRADRRRRGLTVKTYLQAKARLQALSPDGKFTRESLAEECGISLRKLRDWEKANIERT